MNLTQSSVRRIFDYRDGSLFWRETLCTKIRIGDLCGYERKDGYRTIYVNGQHNLAHRLIYLWHFGTVPEFIDHINGVKNDNRPENLRPATRAQNGANRSKPASNTSGFKGVSFHKGTGKFKGQIKINGRLIYLGLFSDPESAHAAYIEAAKHIHREFACSGRDIRALSGAETEPVEA